MEIALQNNADPAVSLDPYAPKGGLRNTFHPIVSSVSCKV